MLPSFADSDRPFLKNVTAKLRSALHLPSTNPHVSRWLFANPLQPFHPDARLLPPEVFTHALSVRMSLDYKDFMTNSNPFASTFPAYGDMPPSESPTSIASLNLLLIPAAHVGGLVLGYSVITVGPTGNMLNPFEVPLDFMPQVRERFCYDPETRHMVIVLNALSEEATGIVSIVWLDDTTRERVFFTVPNEEYDFYNLPSKVLAILQHVENKLPDIPSEVHMPQTESLDLDLTSQSNSFVAAAEPDGRFPLSDDPIQTGITADMLHGLDDLFNLQSGNPSCESSTDTVPNLNLDSALRLDLEAAGRSTAVGVASHALHKQTEGMENGAVVPTGRSPSKGSFDMKELFETLQHLEGALNGHFFAPMLSRDVLDPMTGEILSRTSGKMWASMETVNDKSFDIFRELTVQSYYASTLACSTDRMLTFPGNRRNVRKICEGGGEFVGGRKRARTKVVSGEGMDGSVGEDGGNERSGTVVGDSNESVHGDVSAEGSDSGKTTIMPLLDKDAERVRKLEARKQRNRESAARSNIRKKERLEAQERELAQLKERMQELKEAEQKLVLENMQMKHQLTL